MIKKLRTCFLFSICTFFCSAGAFAGPQLSAGVWWGYQNGANDASGEFLDPALIIYGDDDGSYGPWKFSSEVRFGRGAFTDPENNNSGDNFTVHKAWISYAFSENDQLIVGKSQVPFGWKTANFWPGDMLQGGYGDQMDVGLKYSGKRDVFAYDLALYLQDDWGSTSTDTSDDNGHWGSAAEGAETYRKGVTYVLNLDWSPLQHHTFGVSYQQGALRDLVAFNATGDVSEDGDHQALDLHYYYNRGDITFKYRYIDLSRDFREMQACVASGRCPDLEVKNQRNALHIGYAQDKWNYYLEATFAATDTIGNTSQSVKAFAPGASYHYGPGWIYLEYLWQDGFINRFGDVGEGDFESLYISFDFYY
jgi:hypothetical protein